MTCDKNDADAVESSNRAQIIAIAVREACCLATSTDKQDWEKAHQMIIQNKHLIDDEKNVIINLLRPSANYTMDISLSLLDTTL
ncbi:1781_t:CDS:2 [Cetraspora pellucida]|uniref:1781_t:CDS:1 n=1 Tax=Cetraspora pellucida TaxID=1433469 RepID=A0ACA9N5N7_9GLOM|nr:1781_t:CDS:2 [Cetraspora pellucida]